MRYIENSHGESNLEVPRLDIEPKLWCEERSNVRFASIRSCPENFAGSKDEVRLCEKDVPIDQASTKSFFTVEDVATRVVYHNMYCARCNGAINPLQEPMYFTCKDNMAIYRAKSEDEMVKAVLRAEGVCSFERMEPVYSTLFPCTVEHGKQYVSQCVTNGTSETQDHIVQACDQLNRSIYSVSEGTRIYYKNVFCALCNEKPITYGTQWGCVNPNKQKIIEYLTYSRLRSQPTTIEIPTTDGIICYDTKWTSPDGHCMELNCSPGKILTSKCVTVFSYVRGLRYSLRLWLLPKVQANTTHQTSQETETHERLFESLLEKLGAMIGQYSETFNFTLGLVYRTRTHHLDKAQNISQHMFWLESTFQGNTSSSRDELEASLVGTFIQQEVHLGDLTFMPHALLADAFPLSEFMKYKEHTLSCTSRSIGSFFPESFHFVNVTMTLTCSYVSFAKDSFQILSDVSGATPNVTVIVHINVTEFTFWKSPELNMMAVDELGTLNVCRKLLDSRLAGLKKKKVIYLDRFWAAYFSNDAEALVKYFVTLGCLGLSIVCLVMTMVTYIRLPTLRTSAGINNMFLSFSLLLAQIFLIIAIHSPCPSYLCAVVGVLTHFLWLWMFNWTFLCSFHMYNVFTCHSRRLVTLGACQVRKVVTKVALSLVFPALVVTTVMMTSYLSSGTLGYGDNICYLDLPFIVAVAMVFPIAVITLINIALFITTIVHIRKVRKFQAAFAPREEDNSYLRVYARLSSVTGTLWIISAIAEVVDSDVLRYIHTVLNGLQGVFIFVSFICNKRVVFLLSRPGMEGETNDVVWNTQSTVRR
ncbi:adhesion G protein-coupled receptor E3 [Biomphalaria pfeifferi]|uniref:Adhesion G protein-coupled receptor E3 n=1 Tax=Biomphalaria pfeifferi TaxID=112525 RepID=A0AAD8BKH0_BIOPF|nr:adhesion G protein-coupled receptor E3 [Biomphalaria pfeifferi]